MNKANATGARWRERFTEMVADLRANKSLTVKAKLRAGASAKAIAAVEKALGRPLPAAVVAFYSELDGLEITWTHRKDDLIAGSIDLRRIAEVFGDWKGRVWFDGSEEYREVLPFDVFEAEACAAFRREDPELLIHYHGFGETLAPTGYDFEAYLERVLQSRGYRYWLKTLAEETCDDVEAQEFLATAPELFADFDPAPFRPRGRALQAPRAISLAARLEAVDPADEEWEPPRDLVAAAKRGGDTLAELGRLLRHPAGHVRVNALKLIAEVGAPARALAPDILASVSEMYEAVEGAASVALCALVPERERKRFATQHLTDQQDLRVLAVAESFVALLPAKARARIVALATEGLCAGAADVRLAALMVLIGLEASDDAFAALRVRFADADGDALAGLIRAIGKLHVTDETASLERRQIVARHLDHPDERVATASLGALGGVGLAEAEWERLKRAVKSDSPAVRAAAAESLSHVTGKRKAEAIKLIAVAEAGGGSPKARAQ